ncbi:MAG: hypothetical protein ACK54H_10855 [Phycisphaerales bacterium]|jgi:hypothetical protein
MSYRSSSIVSLCVLSLVGLWSGACATTKTAATNPGEVHTSTGGTVSAVMPASVTMQMLMTAAEEMFRDRGYAIVESNYTEDGGRLIARPPRYSSYPRMNMNATMKDSGILVEFDYVPLPNREVCRASMQALREKLGV